MKDIERIGSAEKYQTECFYDREQYGYCQSNIVSCVHPFIRSYDCHSFCESDILIQLLHVTYIVERRDIIVLHGRPITSGFAYQDELVRLRPPEGTQTLEQHLLTE